MNRCSYAARSLLTGLILAQAIATIQVYLSNLGLYRTMEIIRGYGYLAVPNAHIMPHLKQLLPAFWGGLFFTLTIGVGLSLLSMAAARLWLLFRQKKTVLSVYSIFWLAILIALNRQGPNLLPSAYFLLIPPLVFAVTLRLSPPPDRRRDASRLLVAAAPFLVLAVLWLPQLNREFFGDFRDRMLLSNRFGLRINQFYYDYTLYAAEAFKSLDQRTLKTCRLDLVGQPAAVDLGARLRRYDYLPVDSPAQTDLLVTRRGRFLILVRGGIPVVQTTVPDLLSRAGPLLKEFSLKSDRQMLFRKAVFISLVFGLPLFLYVFFLDLLLFATGLFLPQKAALLASALICFGLGAGLLAVFSLSSGAVNNQKQAARALQSENLSDRVAALKFIDRSGLSIDRFAYTRLPATMSVSERYWLARNLGSSGRMQAYRDLLDFLDDPHPNVACMAYYALGRRGDRRAIPEVLKRITTSRHWYVQWYAYRCLKTLGWTQRRQKGQRAAW